MKQVEELDFVSEWRRSQRSDYVIQIKVKFQQGLGSVTDLEQSYKKH